MTTASNPASAYKTMNNDCDSQLQSSADAKNKNKNYSQAVIYKVSIPSNRHAFALDKQLCIETGRAFLACGNTWRMLRNTRFTSHFDYSGDFRQHIDLFVGCGAGLPFGKNVGQGG